MIIIKREREREREVNMPSLEEKSTSFGEYCLLEKQITNSEQFTFKFISSPKKSECRHLEKYLTLYRDGQTITNTNRRHLD